jgi:ABC-2 type transport system ATP-binding protein
VTLGVETAGSSDGALAALSVRGLRKAYGPKLAVDGIDLDIPPGCFFGLVGPNGAGKTTTLSMVTGLLRPDAGTVAIGGHDVWRDPAAAKRRIGVLPEDLRLFDRLSGAELLTYNGLLRSMPAATVADRSGELLDVLDLTGAAGTLVVDYSHGMRKKIALAAALLHNPRVLFLDEPFEAIDPVSARTIRSLLERYTVGGPSVEYSTHYGCGDLRARQHDAGRPRQRPARGRDQRRTAVPRLPGACQTAGLDDRADLQGRGDQRLLGRRPAGLRAARGRRRLRRHRGRGLLEAGPAVQVAR